MEWRVLVGCLVANCSKEGELCVRKRVYQDGRKDEMGGGSYRFL